MAKKATSKATPKLDLPSQAEPKVIKYKYTGKHPVNVTALGRVVNPSETFESSVVIDNPMFKSVE